LFAATDDGRLEEAEIVLDLSDVEDARVLALAGERGIDAAYVNPGPFRNRLGDAAQKEICDRLRAASVDLVVMSGFMRRLKTPVLEVFSDRILNVHPSLLPKYPGRVAWEQALLAGESETGATIHLVDAGIDSGRILGQQVVPILPNDTPEVLQARIQSTERQLYPKVIAEYASILDQVIESQSWCLESRWDR
jgi:formyltetrahydrofolate-dependent phosphoribosylglycinamide formyltransferase